MTNTTQAENDGVYEFRGVQFPCDSWTIQQLNLALSFNNSKDRYEKVKRIRKGKSQ